MKNRYSHIHDALQYLMMGAGEGRAITYGKGNIQAKKVRQRGMFLIETNQQKGNHGTYFHTMDNIFLFSL